MRKYKPWFTIKHWLLAVLIVTSLSSTAQKVSRDFTPQSFTATGYDRLRALCGKHKQIPVLYEKQILIALGFFPELYNSKIIFRVKHTHTPLSSRPRFVSVIRSSRHRIYIITISDSTEPFLTPILFKNLSFNAQVGVIGHEISHAADFSQKNTFGLLRIGLGNLSQKFLDRFEYRTDSICIAHGLGYQLLSWSREVRKKLVHKNWEGADSIHRMMTRERYMNPETIMRRIAGTTAYFD